MLEFEKDVLDFKSPSGVVGKIDIPAYSELKSIQEQVEKDISNSDEIIKKAIIKWGCEESVYNEFNLSHIKTLWQALLTGKKK